MFCQTKNLLICFPKYIEITTRSISVQIYKRRVNKIDTYLYKSNSKVNLKRTSHKVNIPTRFQGMYVKNKITNELTRL